MIVKGKTPAGFEFEVDTIVIHDMEVIDALAEMGDNPLLISKASLKILGKEQRAKLYDHIRDKDGRVPDGTFSDEFAFIMEKIGDAGEDEKN